MTGERMDSLLLERSRAREREMAADLQALRAALTAAETERDRYYSIAGLTKARAIKAERERDEAHAALRALADSDATCQQDPKAPCAEAGPSELEWPDDWCWPCYAQQLVRAALRATETGDA